MPRKGVVVVPSGEPCIRMRETPPGTQRIANRPIICHVLEALREAGASELAVVVESGSLDEIRASIEPDSEVVLVPHGGSGQPADALAAAASFVGSEPCAVHWSDGLVGQPLAPFTQLFEANSPDLLLLFHSKMGELSSTQLLPLVGPNL